VPKGEPVHIGLHHLAIFGMTQLSGKTTTLEALISRSGLRAIAFKTKRGESGFHSQNIIPPFYKTRSDWQYVEGLVGVALQEKVKYEPGMRSGIMKACQGAQDLKGIQKNAKLLAQTSRSEFMKSVFERLVAYLDIVIPELEKWTFTTEISLNDGINVMDLTDMRLETQQLVIGSAIQYVFDVLSNTVVIIPEAWEMMPELRMTPVKLVAEQFIRKGASVGNYLWIDSQDIGGVSKVPLRQCDNWIMGRMREAHEVERILKQLLGIKIPKEEIQTLPLGHFYAVIGDTVKKVYVLPIGVPEKDGQKVAMGKLSPETIRDKYMGKKESEEEMGNVEGMREEVSKVKGVVDGLIAVMKERDKARDEKERQLSERLDATVKELSNIRQALKGKPVTYETVPGKSVVLNLEEKELVVNLSKTEKPISMTTDNQLGRIMFCALNMPVDPSNPESSRREGFNEEIVSNALDDRGWHMEHSTLAPNLAQLAIKGLLVKIPDVKPRRYRLPTKISINFKES